MVESNNLYGTGYQKCWRAGKRRASSVLKRRKKGERMTNMSLNIPQDKSYMDKNDYTTKRDIIRLRSESKTKFRFLGKVKPIPGYTGHVRRVESDNIFGMTYSKAIGRQPASLDKLKKWQKRALQLGLDPSQVKPKRRKGKKRIRLLPKLSESKQQILNKD